MDVDERAARLRRLRELLRAQLSDPAKMIELAARVHASLVVAGVLVDETQQRSSLRVLRGGAEPSPHGSSIALPPHSTEQVNDERSSAPSTIAPSRGPDRPHDGRGAAATLEPQETIGRRAASTCSASFYVAALPRYKCVWVGGGRPFKGAVVRLVVRTRIRRLRP